MKQLFILACLCLLSPLGHAVDSIRLNDVISQGYGVIDITEPSQNRPNLSMATLELYRQDNNGALVFAVDVNEAANGTEKAASQGVAVDYIQLSITQQGNTTTYTSFTTETQSLLRKAGSTTPALYYTLLGDSGSARITNSSNSDINGSSFDSTLRIPVDQDLSLADSAILVIKFLDTDNNTGDPEAFYDYSNGYEDIALISAADAAYLDELQAGSAEAPLIILPETDNMTVLSNLYYPASDRYYVAAYEDKYPQQGDYDFNDVVVGYQVRLGMNADGDVVRAVVKGYLIARGADYSHDWYFHFPSSETLSGSATLSLYRSQNGSVEQFASQTTPYNSQSGVKVYADTKQLLNDPLYGYANTLSAQSILLGPKFQLVIDFTQPVTTSQLGSAPYDPYIFVHNTAYEIHQPGHAAVLAASLNTQTNHHHFVDASGYPFALLFPNEWQLPLENTDLGLAYPDFIQFIQSQGQSGQNWYLSPQSNQVKNIPASTWRW